MLQLILRKFRTYTYTAMSPREVEWKHHEAKRGGRSRVAHSPSQSPHFRVPPLSANFPQILRHQQRHTKTPNYFSIPSCHDVAFIQQPEEEDRQHQHKNHDLSSAPSHLARYLMPRVPRTPGGVLDKRI